MTRVGSVGYDYTITPPHTFMGRSRMEVESLGEGRGPNTKSKGTKLNNQMERPNQNGKKRKGRLKRRIPSAKKHCLPNGLPKDNNPCDRKQNRDPKNEIPHLEGLG